MKLQELHDSIERQSRYGKPRLLEIRELFETDQMDEEPEERFLDGMLLSALSDLSNIILVL